MDAQITILRKGQALKNFATAGGSIDRGEILRRALSQTLPGDHVHIGEGEYFLYHETGNLKIPDVTLVGAGMGKTILKSDVHSDLQGTAFALGNTDIHNLTLFLSNEWVPTEDGRCVGFDGHGEPAKSARIHDCEIIANAWTVYNWSNNGNKIYLEDCVLRYGRLGLAAMASGSESQFFTAVRCYFDGDASRARDIGATSHRLYGGVYGAVCRSGLMKLVDCEMNLKGKTPVTPSFTPNVMGVSDTFEWASETTPVNSGKATFEVSNLRVNTIANGSTKVYDLHLYFQGNRDRLKLEGGWGSDPSGNGAFKTYVPPPAPPAPVKVAEIDDTYEGLRKRNEAQRS